MGKVVELVVCFQADIWLKNAFNATSLLDKQNLCQLFLENISLKNSSLPINKQSAF